MEKHTLARKDKTIQENRDYTYVYIRNGALEVFQGFAPAGWDSRVRVTQDGTLQWETSPEKCLEFPGRWLNMPKSGKIEGYSYQQLLNAAKE